ncbi:MAG TPA: ABC transporter ATP-binding protein [Acidiphilium sp.]
MNALDVSALSVSYGANEVLRDVALDVRPSERVVLFGPSGSGKTVMLRAIAGLEPGAIGRIVLAGRDVSLEPPEARRLGMAFQNFALYPHMPARENIASPLRAQKLGAGAIEAKVRAVAELLKIDHVLDHFPRQLSNGQKQRTALARALVGEPKLILFDDPLRNVDAKLRYEMRIELPRLLARRETAAIYVTQDFREAMAIGDRVAVLIGGAIVQFAPADVVYDRPATLAIARLFGDPPMNLIPARGEAHGAGVRVHAAGLAFGFDAKPPEEPVFGIRPEAVTLSAGKAPGRVAAQVVAVTPMNERYLVLLRTDDGTELVASHDAPPPGADLWIGVEPGRGALFDAATGLGVASSSSAEEIAA